MREAPEVVRGEEECCEPNTPHWGVGVRRCVALLLRNTNHPQLAPEVVRGFNRDVYNALRVGVA